MRGLKIKKIVRYFFIAFVILYPILVHKGGLSRDVGDIIGDVVVYYVFFFVIIPIAKPHWKNWSHLEKLCVIGIPIIVVAILKYLESLDYL